MQIHPQTFDDPFFWQYWQDLHTLGSHWTDSQQGILCWGFKGVQEEIPREEASTLQIGSDYLTKMGIKTVPHPPYSTDLAPCDFWLFPKLTGFRYETIEEIKEAVMKVIDTLTQEDFHGAFQKLLEQYNKCIAARGDYFEGDLSFMCVLSIKVPIWKKSGNLFNDPHIYKNVRLYFYSWRQYLCGAEEQSQRVCTHEGVIGSRKSQWTNDFSQNLGTYIIYNSHMTCSNSF